MDSRPSVVLLLGCLVACSNSASPSDVSGSGGSPSGAGASAGASAGGGAGANASQGEAGAGNAGAGAVGGSTTGPGGGSGGVIAAAGAPAACPASDVGNTATGKDATSAGAVTSYTYTNVGGAGKYQKIVQGWSKAYNNCAGDSDGTLCNTVYKQEISVNAPLAPFNEEQSLVFSGQTEIYQLGVYYPSGESWQRAAYWDRCVTQGLAFTGNKHWYECNGFVQSYVIADGTKESPTPVQFSGVVPGGTEVNVFAATPCTGVTQGSDCGWSDGAASLHGFAGDAQGNKIFAVKFRMPQSDQSPSYWILPSQVLRTSQYGCNCRTTGAVGCGSAYKGGCGELDVIELVGSDPAALLQSTSIYSFQACYGGVGKWDRPAHESAIFLVIFDAADKQIAIRRLPASGFDFGGSITNATVATWLAMPGGSKAMP